MNILLWASQQGPLFWWPLDGAKRKLVFRNTVSSHTNHMVSKHNFDMLERSRFRNRRICSGKRCTFALCLRRSDKRAEISLKLCYIPNFHVPVQKAALQASIVFTRLSCNGRKCEQIINLKSLPRGHGKTVVVTGWIWSTLIPWSSNYFTR